MDTLVANLLPRVHTLYYALLLVHISFYAAKVQVASIHTSYVSIKELNILILSVYVTQFTCNVRVEF